MKIFRIHWKGGSIKDILGENALSAFREAGYGQEALKALDYVEEIEKILWKKKGEVYFVVNSSRVDYVSGGGLTKTVITLPSGKVVERIR